MAQVTTVLPSGTRAFIDATIPDTTETEVLFIKSNDGGQLSLEEIDGISLEDGVIRVYAVAKGGATPLQLAERGVTFNTPFNFKFKGVYAFPDELVPNPLPFRAAQNMGLIGGGGIRITIQLVDNASVQIGATCDRRVDGPFTL